MEQPSVHAASRAVGHSVSERLDGWELAQVVVECARSVRLQLARERALQPRRLRLVAIPEVDVCEPRPRHGRVAGERPVVWEGCPEPAAHQCPPGPEGGGRGEAALKEDRKAVAAGVESAAAEEHSERWEAAGQHGAGGQADVKEALAGAHEAPDKGAGHEVEAPADAEAASGVPFQR